MANAKESRFSRYEDILPPKLLSRDPITIIGCGAGGRQIGLLLASMGVSAPITLWDHDKVDITNLGTQGWCDGDVGSLKVDVLDFDMHKRHPGVDIEAIPRKYNPIHEDMEAAGTIFLCVDSIEARREIMERMWDPERRESYGPWKVPYPKFVADGRMLLENIRGLYVTDQASYQEWMKTLFAPEQAEAGRCTARTTLYAATMSASMQVAVWTQWLRGYEIPLELTANMLAWDMDVVRSKRRSG